MAKAWSKDLKLDPYTFGNSKACEVLADMMNKGMIPVFEKHRVLSFITGASRVFKEISSIENKGVGFLVSDLYRQSLISKIDQMPYPLKFKTYLKNVINHIYKKYL